MADKNYNVKISVDAAELDKADKLLDSIEKDTNKKLKVTFDNTEIKALQKELEELQRKIASVKQEFGNINNLSPSQKQSLTYNNLNNKNKSENNINTIKETEKIKTEENNKRIKQSEESQLNLLKEKANLDTTKQEQKALQQKKSIEEELIAKKSLEEIKTQETIKRQKEKLNNELLLYEKKQQDKKINQEQKLLQQKADQESKVQEKQKYLMDLSKQQMLSAAQSMAQTISSALNGIVSGFKSFTKTGLNDALEFETILNRARTVDEEGMTNNYNLEDYKKRANELSLKYGVDNVEVANLFESMAQLDRSPLNVESLEILEGALKSGIASGFEASGIAEITTQMYNAFDGKYNPSQILDSLNFGIDRGFFNWSDIQTYFGTNANLSANAGEGLEGMIASIISSTQNGMKVSKAALNQRKPLELLYKNPSYSKGESVTYTNSLGQRQTEKIDIPKNIAAVLKDAGEDMNSVTEDGIHGVFDWAIDNLPEPEKFFSYQTQLLNSFVDYKNNRDDVGKLKNELIELLSFKNNGAYTNNKYNEYKNENSAKIEVAKNQIDSLKAQVMDTFLPMIGNIAQTISNINPGVIKALMLGFVGIGATAFIAQKGLNLISTILSIKMSLAALTAAASLQKLALSLNTVSATAGVTNVTTAATKGGIFASMLGSVKGFLGIYLLPFIKIIGIIALVVLAIWALIKVFNFLKNNIDFIIELMKDLGNSILTTIKIISTAIANLFIFIYNTVVGVIDKITFWSNKTHKIDYIDPFSNKENLNNLSNTGISNYSNISNNKSINNTINNYNSINGNYDINDFNRKLLSQLN